MMTSFIETLVHEYPRESICTWSLCHIRYISSFAIFVSHEYFFLLLFFVYFSFGVLFSLSVLVLLLAAHKHECVVALPLHFIRVAVAYFNSWRFFSYLAFFCYLLSYRPFNWFVKYSSTIICVKEATLCTKFHAFR